MIVVDLAGFQQRGLAMGLNEFAGYLAVGAGALATGFVAARFGRAARAVRARYRLRGDGLLLSAAWVRETHHHVRAESCSRRRRAPPPSARAIFAKTTLTDNSSRA
ncbi:MAG: hypothetical protein U0235_05435 [Polyangiaceae bacterium]